MIELTLLLNTYEMHNHYSFLHIIKKVQEVTE